MFTIVLLVLCVTVVKGSHFLGGTINWRVQNFSSNSTSVSILITQTYSWTYVTGRCDNNSIATNQPVAGSAGTLACSPSCPVGFGIVSSIPYCTDVSSLNGIAVGQRSDIVLIPKSSDFSIIYASNAWGTLTPGGSDWSISSRINLVTRSDNDMFNNAPVATVMSPINILWNNKTLITVSVSDADGDIIRCRWATASSGINECGSVCPPSSLPSNTAIYSNCTIEITGPAIGNRYAVALMVEDFINASSTVPLSSVPVQFIVQVIAPPSCPTLPETMLTGQTCTPVKVNETFISQLLGVNHCGENVSIIDIATLSFPGMKQGSLTKLSSLIYYKTLSWTPTIDQLGYQAMCAMALDSQYVQSAQYCFTFYVTENGTDTCPGVINNSTTAMPSATTLITTIESSTTSAFTSTETPPSNCISWPLIASLAALACLAMLCNCCLLYYSCIGYKNGYRRKSYHSDLSHTSLTSIPASLIRSNVVPNEWAHIICNENISRANIHQTRLNHTKADNFTHQRVISSLHYPDKKLAITSSNQSNSYIQSLNHHHTAPMIISNSPPFDINRSKMHVKDVFQPRRRVTNEVHPSKIETITILPNLNIEHINAMNNRMITPNIFDPIKSQTEDFQKTNITFENLSSANIIIRHGPRP